MKKVKINNKWFLIQSYLQDEFSNLIDPSGTISSIRVDYVNKTFSSWGKQDEKWKIFISENRDALLNSNDIIFAIFLHVELGKDFYEEMKKGGEWLKEQVERAKKGLPIVTQGCLFSGV